jgi:hypothetical protein
MKKRWTTENTMEGESLRLNKLIKTYIEVDDDDDDDVEL